MSDKKWLTESGIFNWKKRSSGGHMEAIIQLYEVLPRGREIGLLIWGPIDQNLGQ